MIHNRIGVVYSNDTPTLLLNIKWRCPWTVEVLVWKITELRDKSFDIFSFRVNLLSISDRTVVLHWSSQKGWTRAMHPTSTADTGLKIKHERFKGVLSMFPTQPQITTGQESSNRLSNEEIQLMMCDSTLWSLYFTSQCCGSNLPGAFVWSLHLSKGSQFVLSAKGEVSRHLYARVKTSIQSSPAHDRN